MRSRVAAVVSGSTRSTVRASGETTQNAPSPYATRAGLLPTATSPMTLPDLASIRTSEFPRTFSGSTRDAPLPPHAVANATVARTTQPSCRRRRLRITRARVAFPSVRRHKARLVQAMPSAKAHLPAANLLDNREPELAVRVDHLGGASPHESTSAGPRSSNAEAAWS